MHEFLVYAVLGLGTGAVYAMLAQGVVLIYRGSGVVNFAQGGFAMVGAFIVNDLRGEGWPVVLAIVTSAALTGLLAAACYLLIMRPLRSAALLVQVIATLAILLTLQAAAGLIWGSNVIIPDNVIPADRVNVLGVDVSSDRLWLLVIAAVFTALLWALSRKTRFGLATKAVSENQLAAQTLGWSPDRLGLINWSIAGALAAVAGALVAPITSLQVTNLSFVVFTGLAAALLAKFDSFPLAMIFAVGLGMSETLAGHFIHAQGYSTAMPFLITVVVLVLRSKSFRARGESAQRLPDLGTGRVHPLIALVAVVLAIVITNSLTETWADSVVVTAASAVLVLSVVVLTGYTGQISLAQAALGGVGALVAGRLVSSDHWPFELAALTGIAAAIFGGLVLALPALRTRGINFALVTLGLGISAQAVLFNNFDYTGGSGGTTVGPQTFLGLDIDGVLHPAHYAIFSICVLSVLMVLVSNLRRSTAGRRLIAVRSNERAAAATGINVVRAKFFAFGVSAAIAGFAGVLIAFHGYSVSYVSFSPQESIIIVAYAVIGGIGFVSGGILGSTLFAGAVGAVIFQDVLSGADEYITLIGGLMTIALLLQNPDGLSATQSRGLRKLSQLLRRRGGGGKSSAKASALEKATPSARERVTSLALDVSGLSVRYGGLVALEAVDLHVAPGEIVGVIGPNGAGKTTLLDAVTGFTKAGGQVIFGGRDVSSFAPHRRAQLGMSRSFQSLELFEELTVRENLSAGSDDQASAEYLLGLLRAGKTNISPAARAASVEFNLDGDLDRRPGALSQGRRRLVAIARAVAAQPSVLLLDEPAAGLDELESRELAPLLRTLAREWGIGILLVEHDMPLVMGVCDKVVVLNFGHVIATGTPAEIRGDAAVLAAYLGDAEHDATPESPTQAPVGAAAAVSETVAVATKKRVRT